MPDSVARADSAVKVENAAQMPAIVGLAEEMVRMGRMVLGAEMEIPDKMVSLARVSSRTSNFKSCRIPITNCVSSNLNKKETNESL